MSQGCEVVRAPSSVRVFTRVGSGRSWYCVYPALGGSTPHSGSAVFPHSTAHRHTHPVDCEPHLCLSKGSTTVILRRGCGWCVVLFAPCVFVQVSELPAAPLRPFMSAVGCLFIAIAGIFGYANQRDMALMATSGMLASGAKVHAAPCRFPETQRSQRSGQSESSCATVGNTTYRFLRNCCLAGRRDCYPPFAGFAHTRAVPEKTVPLCRTDALVK